MRKVLKQLGLGIISFRRKRLVMKYCQLKCGQTLVIREAVKEDASKVNAYKNIVGKETDNLTFGEGEYEITAEREAEGIESISKSDNQLMLCTFISDQLVGQLRFTGGSRPRIKHTGEFGVTVLKEHWGRGIAGELISYLVEWAKATQIVRKINLWVRSDNQRAISLYRKFGFVSEGLVTREFFINGKFYDVIHMGMEID
jgi:RimJ/RimL family protein N-acetyltransferase